MKILVTGAAGFIGFHVCKALLANGHLVIGLDSINDYYDPNLKFARLKELGLRQVDVSKHNKTCTSESFKNLKFYRLNLLDRDNLRELFQRENIEVVCHLAAQPGVRYSLENPEAYIDSNIVGFLNILENCRHFKVKHLVYASSSSVYGLNKKVPFETTDNVDHPISLYAATKKSNELMAYTYSHLYGIPTTGLRFFTVYGPWGRPDMAYFLFTKAIIKGDPIKVFNHSNMERDFTFIDDIVQGVVRITEDTAATDRNEKYRLYNIGKGEPDKLMDMINEIENNLNLTAIKELTDMQPGDVTTTWASVKTLQEDYKYKPQTPLTKGIKLFVDWYLAHYEK
jgi:UDP-glucuronate 4-epimerase